VFYRVIDARKTAYRVVDINKAVGEKTIAAIRSVCGEHTMQEMLEKREKISDELAQQLYHKVDSWGVFVDEVFIKDMQLS